MGGEKDGKARLAENQMTELQRLEKWIRMTRIDELPQFINVLRGDMSIRPRPERLEPCENTCKKKSNLQCVCCKGRKLQDLRRFMEDIIHGPLRAWTLITSESIGTLRIASDSGNSESPFYERKFGRCRNRKQDGKQSRKQSV